MHSDPDNELADPGILTEALFRNNPDAIVVTDIHDTIRLVNPAFEILFGYSYTEINGRKSRDLYVDQDRFDLVHATPQHSLDGNNANFYEYELDFLKKNGEILYAQAVIGHITDASSQLIGCITFIHDITRHRRDHSILKQREREMSSIIETVPIMLYLKDIRDLRYVYLNEAGEKLIGQSSDWLLGKTAHDILPPDQAASTTDSDREVIASGETVEIDQELIRTPHGDRIFSTRKTVIWCGEGKPLYLLGLSEDITERKEAREELQRRREQLEDIANSVPGALYQFHRDTEGNITLPYVSEGMRRILGLPDDADITDPNTLRACVHPDDIIVLEETSRAALSGPGQWEAEFRVCTNSGIKWLHGHAHPRQQPDGSILFNGVVTDVSDRHSMEERLLTERKQTLTAYRSKQEELKRICNEQRAAVDGLSQNTGQSGAPSSDSELNAGIQKLYECNDRLRWAIDTMSPPRQHGTIPDMEEVQWAVADQQVQDKNRVASAATVLYIEDNPSNLALLEQAFAKQDEFSLYTATTPVDGLNQARRLLPDIMLLDINLPGMNGYELLSELRADPELATRPAIAITAQAMPWDIEKGRQAGFQAYITKPIDIAELLQTLREILQG